MPEELKLNLENIDGMIVYWRNECSDIDPSNVDSMDRGQDVDDLTARKAICLVPALLEELKACLVREKEGEDTELSRTAHSESRKWLQKLAEWLS